MLMPEQELTLILVISIRDVNKGLAAIRELEKKLLFHLLIIPVNDLVLIRTTIKTVVIQFLALTEILSHVLIDKRNIVTDLPHFENLLATESEFFIPVRSDADIV